jgi:hypothetical protein
MSRFRNTKEIEELEQIVVEDLASDNPLEFLKKLMPVTKRFDRELIGAYRRFRHGFKTATGCETDYRIIVEHPDLGGFVLDATGRHPFGPSKTADDFTTAAPTEPLREVMH